MTEKPFSLTEGPIASGLVRFALPLFFGNLFQQLYNTVDALIVGNLLGNRALAAVSSTSMLIFTLVGFFNGLSIGAGVVIAQYFGAKDIQRLRQAIHTNFAFSLMMSAVLTLLGVTLTPAILQWMETPAEVMPQAVLYVRIYFAGSAGLVLYNTFMGIMQSVGDSRHPLYYLIFSSILNVVLDLVLIGLFDMDVDGAALATVLAQLISAVLCLRRLMKAPQDYRIRLQEIRVNGRILRQIIRFGLPGGIQNSLIAATNTVVQSHVNVFGEMAMSGIGAYNKIEDFFFLPIKSFTTAITTFVGQNLGAKAYDRVRKGSRFGFLCSMGLALLSGVIILISAPVLVGAFTDEPAAIAFGVDKAQICALFYFLPALSHALSAVLRGAGHAVAPTLSILLSWGIFRMLLLLIFAPMTQTIAIVNWVFPISWLLSAAILVIYYRLAHWLPSVNEA